MNPFRIFNRNPGLENFERAACVWCEVLFGFLSRFLSIRTNAGKGTVRNWYGPCFYAHSLQTPKQLDYQFSY